MNNVGDLDEWLKAHANTLDEGIIFGGTRSPPWRAGDRVEKAAQSVTSNQDLHGHPTGDATLTVAGDATPTANATTARYTVNGLDDTKTYTVALFPCANVTTDANGVDTFKDADARQRRGRRG